MARSNASAKKAGAQFERDVADYLNVHVDDRIDRRVKTGANDKGDIAGVRVHGERMVIECKNRAQINLGTWANEAEVERLNDGALTTAIVHKRHGKGQPGDQWVTLTLRDLVALITGVRPE